MKKTSNKYLIILASFLLLSFSGRAQMTLQHTFAIAPPEFYSNYAEVVNLSISGKKIMVITDTNVLSFYNLDSSLCFIRLCDFIGFLILHIYCLLTNQSVDNFFEIYYFDHFFNNYHFGYYTISLISIDLNFL